MIDLETKLRAGLHSLADTSPEVVVPPLSTIEAAARARGRNRSRARRMVAFAIVGVVGTAGIATATGVLPRPVERTLDEFDSWGYETSGDAERVATLEANGYTYEIWRAPLTTGGECVYERKFSPGGDVSHGGSSACTPDPTDESALYPAAYPAYTGDGATAWGQLPEGGVAIVFRLSNGSTYEVAAQRDRYFLTAFDGVPDGTRLLGEQVKRADGTLYTP
jgi:hypothetical protein